MPRRPIRQQTDRTGDSDETYDPATDLHHGHGEPTSVRLNTAGRSRVVRTATRATRPRGWVVAKQVTEAADGE
jgi:hypothetical protein